MDPAGKLEEIFRHFPGIGPRQAKRFVYFLLSKSDRDLEEFSSLLVELKKSIDVCQKCMRLFPIGSRAKSENPVCNICSDQNRDQSSLMIVSRDIDMQAIEKSRAFNGVYFVLGGSVPLLDENPAEKIRQKELLSRISELSKDLREIIIATNANPEGENTLEYLKILFKNNSTGNGGIPAIEGLSKARVSTLGRGLSTGTELEYSDSETLRSALENRR